MNSNEKELFEKFKEITASCNFINENTYTPKTESKRRYFMKRKIIATACASLLLITGIVYAITTNTKNKTENDRGLGLGVKTATDKGYLENPNMKFLNFDDIGTEVKIKDFFMDDLNLSVNFLFKFSDDITETYDSMNVFLKDLIVRDEENKIIFGGYSSDEFNKYCKEHNLNYTYLDFNENYYNCGLNNFSEKENDLLKLTYNIYSTDFPKSKKLYFSFKTIQISGYTKDHQPQGITLEGSWFGEVNVPEIMYNRSIENYKVISCDNEEIEIYSAYATNVGFEIETNIPLENRDKYLNREKSYIENENGEQFKISYSVSRRGSGEIYMSNHYETFDMTKYNSTDKVKLVLDYKGTPVTIQLEKLN